MSDEITPYYIQTDLYHGTKHVTTLYHRLAPDDYNNEYADIRELFLETLSDITHFDKWSDVTSLDTRTLASRDIKLLDKLPDGVPVHRLERQYDAYLEHEGYIDNLEGISVGRNLVEIDVERVETKGHSITVNIETGNDTTLRVEIHVPEGHQHAELVVTENPKDDAETVFVRRLSEDPVMDTTTTTEESP